MIQPLLSRWIQLLEFSLFDEGENRHDECWRIHLEDVLIYKLHLWHH